MMKASEKYPNGISSYSQAKLTIYFPFGKYSCENCWLKSKDSSGRDYCRYTSRLLWDAKGGVSDDCPLELDDEVNNA